MTHFVGLVVADTEAEIAALVQPFHEYECTGIEDQYVREVDRTDVVREHLTKYGEPGQTFEEFAAGDGYTLRDGRAYIMTNPDKRWDWWVVGGRWSGVVPGNTCKVEAIPQFFTDWQPQVLIDASGWHEAAEYGWFGFSKPSDTPEAVEQKMAEHAGKRVWVVDFHI